MRWRRSRTASSDWIPAPAPSRPATTPAPAGPATDERAALDAEIGRLQADNEKLKTELAAREPSVPGKIDEPLPKADSLKKPEPKVAEGERKIEIPLPSDRDMDRMMSFLERAWRRLVEIANRMQKDFSGKI
jgi:hypothetical protein